MAILYVFMCYERGKKVKKNTVNQANPNSDSKRKTAEQALHTESQLNRDTHITIILMDQVMF